MELQFGVFRFLPTTHVETNANKMCPRSLWAMWHFTHVYLHAHTTVHMHLTNQDYFDQWKSPRNTWIPPIGAHAEIKMSQVMGSLVYVCGKHTGRIMTRCAHRVVFYCTPWNYNMSLELSCALSTIQEEHNTYFTCTVWYFVVLLKLWYVFRKQCSVNTVGHI